MWRWYGYWQALQVTISGIRRRPELNGSRGEARKHAMLCAAHCLAKGLIDEWRPLQFAHATETDVAQMGDDAEGHGV